MVVTLVDSHDAIAIATVFGGKGGRGVRGENGGAVLAETEDNVTSRTRYVKRCDILMIPEIRRECSLHNSKLS